MTERIASPKGMPRVPIRIYALAKELKLDSKELVDICTKVLDAMPVFVPGS